MTLAPGRRSFGLTMALGSGWLYAAACVVIPAAWGLAMAWLFGAVERRRKAAVERRDGDPPPIDYSI